jgi:hypothetical protein
VLRVSARSDRATFGTNYWLYPNGSTTTSSYTYIYGTGSTVGSGNGTAGGIYMGVVNGANQTANSFASSEIYIPNYAGATYKPMSIFNVNEYNSASTAPIEIDANAGLYNATTAISSLTIQAGSYNWVSGSSFYLYGI